MKNKTLPVFPLLLALVFISGCTFIGNSGTIGGGLIMNMRADPQTVFAGSDVRIDIDIENDNPREIGDVSFGVFDAGILQLYGDTGTGICAEADEHMRPGDLGTLTCNFRAPSIQQDSITTTVSARASYITQLSLAQVMDIMNEDEYVRRQQQGQLATGQRFNSYSDKNVRIDIEFSDDMPIVVRSDPRKRYYMYITIDNIGNGFISDIEPGQLSIVPVNSLRTEVDDIVVENVPEGVVSCPQINEGALIKQTSGQFQRIACEILLPQDVRVIENYGLLVTLEYDYEIRQSVDVKIIR